MSRFGALGAVADRVARECQRIASAREVVEISNETTISRAVGPIIIIFAFVADGYGTCNRGQVLGERQITAV